jgi:pimeloyl-ACP methyl ester carboxylesterase
VGDGRARLIDVGSGPPLLLIPGVQGRWEWMRLTVEALARHFRVLTFTLAGERSSGQPFDPHLGFDNFVIQIDRVLEKAAVRSAIVCGISYGGLIALRYAACRPGTVRGLVLASALAPGFKPDSRARFYMRAPRLLMPLFFAGASQRAREEVCAAFPTWRERLRFSVRQGWIVAKAPPAPRLMRDRLLLLDDVDFSVSAARVVAPTLLVTGDPGLDRVVPVAHTRQYEHLLRSVEHVQLERTGHQGTVTRPDAFATLLAAFAARLEERRTREPEPVAR